MILKYGIFYSIFTLLSFNVSSNQLIWSTDEFESLSNPKWDSDSTRPLISTWPKNSDEICREPEVTDQKLPRQSQKRYFCKKFNKKAGFQVTTSISSNSHFKYYPLGDSLDNMGSTGGKIKTLWVNQENGRKWHTTPSFFSLNSKYTFMPGVLAYLKINIRKTYDAWFDDALAFNVPQSTEHIDINEPSLGYIYFGKKYLDLTIGRFPLHWSPSPRFGMTFSSSSPYFDGIYGVLKSSFFSYHYLIAGMDPWLSGTPASFGDSIPIGSEEYINQNPDYLDYPEGDFNARNKFYSAPHKTFTAHRVQFATQQFILGLTEISMVGGKAPSLRDVLPMIAKHNNNENSFILYFGRRCLLGHLLMGHSVNMDLT